MIHGGVKSIEKQLETEGNKYNIIWKLFLYEEKSLLFRALSLILIWVENTPIFLSLGGNQQEK